MASVFIDIPGVGNVEAKNAATESTLRELVNIMKGVQQNTKNKSGPGAGGAGGSADDAKGPAQKLTSMAGRAGDSLGKFYKSVTPAIGAVAGFTDGLVNTIQAFANVGDSVERAADVFSGIPIVGTIFTAVAGAAQKVTDSYLAVARSGATFGGSINNFAVSASAAGMTMENFGRMVAKNGEGMLGLASNTEEGAKRFAQISKALRTSSGDLYALGFSTEDINQGLATYSANLRQQGLQGKKSNAELAAGAKSYLKEIDMLAKITGEERSAKESQMKALLADAQFNAAMAGKDELVRKDFANFVGGFGPKMGGFVKDFIATGTTTTEANAKIAAMLGTDVMNQLTGIRQKMLRNERLTDEEQDLIKKTAKKVSETQMIQSGGALAASRDMDDATGAMVENMGYTDDAHVESRKSQDKATAGTDLMNEKMQKAQQMLAGFSNSFQMALANSGMLDLMLKAFQFVAGFVQTFLVPAFQILSSIITGVSSIVTEYLYPAFVHIADYIAQSVQPIFQAMGEFIDTSVTPVFKSMGEFVDAELMPIFRAMGEFIDKNLSTILDGLGIALAVLAGRYLIQNGLELVRTGITVAGNIAMGLWNLAVGAGAAAMALLTSPVFLVIAGITALWLIFKKLGGDTKIVGDMFSWMGLKMKDWWLQLKEGLFSLLNKIPGMRGDFDEDLKEIATEREKNAEERSQLEQGIVKRAAENRAKLDEKQTAEQASRHQRVDKKLLDQKESANAQQKAALDAKRNLDDSETNLLVDEATRQKSAYIKDKPSTSVATAEATKASIVTEAEQKRAAAEAPAKKAEEEKKSEDSKKESEKGPAPSTQDSPATLLASLNTKMDQLIKHAAVTQSNTYETYRNTNGLSGNLYKSV
jgi:hypothetical protein